MEEKPTAKRGGARPGAGRRPNNAAGAGKTYTFRFAGAAAELLDAQPEGQRNAFVEAALLAYRPA